MSDAIRSVGSAGLPLARVEAATDPKAAAAAKKNRGLEEASREFEAIFVRSMLKSSGIGGGDAAYSDMAVDAVAKSITAGNGLGLGELIRRAVETAEKAEPNLKVLK